MGANGKINQDYKTGRISKLPAEERWSETEFSLYLNFKLHLNMLQLRA